MQAVPLLQHQQFSKYLSTNILCTLKIYLNCFYDKFRFKFYEKHCDYNKRPCKMIMSIIFISCRCSSYRTGVFSLGYSGFPSQHNTTPKYKLSIGLRKPSKMHVHKVLSQIGVFSHPLCNFFYKEVST